ncbi:heavy-metal-associated domain-containing protein [Shinella kummerowiae]|uniref:heavy-metal-associated domain-containing protein n=1 Tax=Shinella kummerowiae TaxID=417745 RepID=UPI0021B6CE9F|nr:heavy-metal-associated domain-containing protein [Shinella kummerowiae]MCT7665010.1 heavy-metal-associated domain-containing protein [Shinella kummerowiae]
MKLTIENMTCGGCARSVTKAIQSVDPNARVDTNPAIRSVEVETNATLAAVKQVLEDAGYPASAD